MNISQHLLESIGWTLVHSLWQGGVIFALLYVVSRSINDKAANQKYVAGLSAFVLVVATSLVTFVVIYTTPATGSTIASVTTSTTLPTAGSGGQRPSEFYYLLSWTLAWIDMNLIWVIRLWLIGSFVGLLKMGAGMLYISFLRRQAQPVVGNWEEKVNQLATGLHITRGIRVAEAAVSTPVVIGYLKPLILFPVGMIAGLAPRQVEAILIHELAHIHRHDFIINLFQCLVESLLFFNPFVWMISSRIRDEREHCCDDTVIQSGIEPIVYVRALAAIEGAYSSSSLAVGFLGQRHQLLNRMKRVMEKSVKRELSGAKLLPLSLVVIGLVCASWLSVGVGNEPADFKNKENGIVTDTTAVPDNDSNSPVTRLDTDESAVTPFERPFIPGFDHAPADISFLHMPPPHIFEDDSIPGFLYAPNADWTEFELEFTSKFQKEFGDFFEKNKGQIEKMMKELREQHGDDGFMYSYEFNNFSDDQRRAVEAEMALINPQLQNLNFALPQASADVWRMKEQAELLSQKALADHDWSVQQQDLAVHYEQLAREQEEFMVNNELFMLDQEERLRVYEKEMIDQLTEDGYLDKSEKARDLHIQNGEVTINGKKVKKADEAKYKAIIDRFNSHPRIPHRPE